MARSVAFAPLLAIVLLVPASVSAADVPFSVTGKTATAACLAIPAAPQCRTAVPGESAAITVADLTTGTEQRVRGTMVWQPDSFATSQLTIYLQSRSGGTTTNLASVTSGSPLSFDFSLVALGGTNHVLSVHAARYVQQNGVGVIAEGSEQFRIDGIVTTV